MDLPWGDEKTHSFVTNVGLITSDGPFGPNIMACEWTHMVSYSPGLLAICLRIQEATYANVKATKEFGVSLASHDQNQIASIAGGNSGKRFHKIKALQELGYPFYKAKNIKVMMVKGAVLNIECKVLQEIPLGDHVMFVGEVLDVSKEDKQPLVYHQRKYWKLGENIPRPSEEELAHIQKVVQKFEKH